MERIILLAFSLLVSVLLFNVSPVAACSPLPPDWWFIEKFSIEPAHLPPDIVISSAVQPSEAVAIFTGPKAGQITRGSEPRGHLKIDNQSVAPFYLVASDVADIEPVEQLPVTLPEGMAPVFRLEPDQSVALAIEAVSTLDPTFTDHNQQSYDRPAEITPPSAQTVNLTVVHKNRRLTLPLLLSYVLNPNFNADALSGCANFYQGVWLKALASVGVGLIVVVGIIYLGWKAWRNG